MSCPGLSLKGVVLPSEEKQLVYSTAPADWAIRAQYTIKRVVVTVFWGLKECRIIDFLSKAATVNVIYLWKDFFILSFFVGYIISFGLVRCTHWVQLFTLARGGCDNHRCHNKNPGLEMGLGTWMTSCLEAMGWDSCVFWKKQFVEIWDWTKRVGIRIWARPVQFFAAGCACVGWVSELRADAGGTVSIVKTVSLSLLVLKT